MLYCVSCHAVFSTGTSCPLCHKRNIRQVQDSDLCFFTEQTSVMSSVVEDILKQNGLRFVTRPVYGAAISVFFARPKCRKLQSGHVGCCNNKM